MKPEILIIYLIVNLIVFGMYGIDKQKAIRHQWRIPEHTLILGAVFGVFGAYVGMHVFHHKTKKPKFYIGVPVIFFAEMIVVIVSYLM